jgi:alpha-galactosidase
MDDGWFGQRKDDHAGLGDCYVNTTKLPHGLKPLIEKVHTLGMDFRLWVEPEMVNHDSDFYREHPDWFSTSSTGFERKSEISWYSTWHAPMSAIMC